ncbi:hypothetical protein CRG98_038142 [Punica granatum]|uniref:Uncharacterized protein n=1 Tax=Punica granatum TaxID=22663 RepID=A0A2I0IBV0_PUNGR|nr:hypothetical protein CRG98_038142 [Punica granatum]
MDGYSKQQDQSQFLFWKGISCWVGVYFGGVARHELSSLLPFPDNFKLVGSWISRRHVWAHLLDHLDIYGGISIFHFLHIVRLIWVLPWRWGPLWLGEEVRSGAFPFVKKQAWVSRGGDSNVSFLSSKG